MHSGSLLWSEGSWEMYFTRMWLTVGTRLASAPRGARRTSMQKRTARRRILLRTNLTHTTHTRSPTGRPRRAGRRLVDDSLRSRHARMDSVGDAHRQRAHVVGHHSVRHVHLHRIRCARPASVRACPRPLRTDTSPQQPKLSVKPY